MAEHIGIHKGLAEAALEPKGAEAVSALQSALRAELPERRQAVAAVVRDHPDWPDAWAELGALAGDDVEAYACYRVGYHRGLDALRKEGWRGSGYVRWRHAGNRGFLKCVEGLRRNAQSIGEDPEALRCAQFLRQLDPDWPPAELAGGGE